MKTVLIVMALLFLPLHAQAVTMAEDIATTIMLRGHPCGGATVSQVSEKQDGAGNRIIQATCPNGKRYQVSVSSDGRVSVKPLN